VTEWYVATTIPVAEWTKVWVCSGLFHGVAGSNPNKCMDFVSAVYYVGSGLCHEIVTRREDSYSVCVCV